MSEQFSYSFTLTHSSRSWDYTAIAGGYNVFPNRLSNSGIGWSFHMGLLLSPGTAENPGGGWKYVDPAGGEHLFHPTLHDGEMDGDTINAIDYTRDSTYMRLTHQALGYYEIEFPDGSVKKFEHQAGRPATEFRLTEIRDHFYSGLTPQNWVRIAYNDTLLTWTITDSTGRSHVVKFVSLTYDSATKPMVDYVDLAAFDGTPARWDFTYAAGGASSIWRECRQAAAGHLTVPVLGSVTRPDGTTWAFTDYDADPGVQHLECKQAVLSDLTFPTGGRVHYDYAGRLLPANDPCPDPSGLGELYLLVLTQRKFIDNVVRNPANPDAVWSYEYTPNAPGVADICGGPEDEVLPPEELTVTVFDPLNNKTEYFFSVWPAFQPSPSGFLRSEYGLPFTRLDPVSGRFLSSISYDCNSPGLTCDPKRFNYVLYEQDGGSVEHANRRLQVQRTVYDDDSDVWTETARSSFDGVGHYRQESTAGNFDATSQTTFTNFNPARGTYPGSYTVLPITASWALNTYDRMDTTGGTPVDTSRSTFDFDAFTGSLKSVRTFKAGSAGGLIAGPNDLVTLYCRDLSGNATSESSYGGDGARFQLPGSFPTCASGVPSAGWQYRVDHGYASGVRKSSKYNGTAHFTLDLTINPATGLPSASRDTALVETQFVYDDLGRLVRSKPIAFSTLLPDAQTEYTFWPPGISGGILHPASVEVERCPPDQSTCTSGNRYTDEYVEVTGFGRSWHEVRDIPDTSDWAVRVTRYNPMGWAVRVSTWLADADVQFANENTLSATAFGGYDAFGRPTTITQPDGAATTHQYLGARWVRTEQNLALTLSGADQCVRRWDRSDRFGRMDRVEEAYTSCTSGGTPTAVTEYSYDEAGHVAKVCQNMSGATCGQSRSFFYDNRGFLSSEQHPEKGTSGGGTVGYSCYDARGHSRYRDDGSTSRRLAFTFDLAERLTKVRVPSGAETCDQVPETGTTWKQFTFATANSGSNARMGKLETASSRNELGLPAFAANSVANVLESYTYQERGGRISKRTTAVSGAGVASETWEVSQIFDPLGLIATQNYPICTVGSACAGAPSAWGVSMTYAQGMLKSIVGTDMVSWLSNMTYYPSGMPASVTHGGGLLESIVQASHGMPRPDSITITSPSPEEPVPFTTGTYAYDGAGNVKTIGSDHYRYDKLQRLVEAQMGSLAPSQNQTATFDAYGNLTAMNTNGTSVNFPTSGTSNRLTSASYDSSGNTTAWSGNTYSWDPLNRMTHWSNGSEGWSYVYTADDERLWAIKDVAGGGYSTWTLRGLGNNVLTRDERFPGAPFSGSFAPGDCASSPPLAGVFCDGFEGGSTSVWSSSGSGTPRTITDYVYRQGQLLAASVMNGDIRHFGLDHLGTVRIATDFFGNFGAVHTYFPFGTEATSASQDAEVMKFTGHERDLQSTPSSPADDMDYMHARFHSPLTGRMLSV
ncbi:MAG: hypothetical protein ABI639_11825, partial [Thermoanaerobaculia bacterium]